MLKKEMWIDQFDSQIIGKTVAKCNIDQQDIEDVVFNQKDIVIDGLRVDLLFCYVPCDRSLIQKVERWGYRLINTRIAYAYQEKIPIRSAAKDFFYNIVTEKEYVYDVKDVCMQDIVKDLSDTSHYAKDEFLGPDVSLYIYRQWIENTFKGYAERVFIALDGIKPVGFISLRTKKDGMYIDLIGVHSSKRGSGIGKELVNCAIMYAQKREKKLWVFTQMENIPANRLYQKSDFVVTSFSLVYHKFFTNILKK